MAPAEEDEEVIAEYDVFITPQLKEQIYLIQYPNRARDQPYNERTNSKPAEMRIKPKTGFMEIDISTTVHANFDKTKGLIWGEALKSAKDHGAAGFGLASGFGKGSRSTELFAAERAHISRRREEESVKAPLSRFQEANEDGRVLNRQTLGGQVIKPELGKPIYMLGAFKGKQLHLTEVTGVAQMRPQFHHIDANAQIVKNKVAHKRAVHEPSRAAEPRMIQQMARATGADGEELNISQTSAFLSAAAEEQWRRLNYHDEDVDEAYNIYHEKLFVQDTANSPHLQSDMNNEQYLDAISAPKVDLGSRPKRKPPLTKKERSELAEDSDGQPS